MPSWPRLYQKASTQDGYVTLRQVHAAGYSTPLLAKYLANGKVRRAHRGIYRLVHFPPSEHEDLMVAWLWSGAKGVFSHETALALHRLSDAMPAQLHLTVPVAWETRRLKVPRNLELHFGDTPRAEVGWVGSVRVTSPQRTIVDCISAAAQPDLLQQAIADGVKRGVLSSEFASQARRRLRRSGGERR